MPIIERVLDRVECTSLAEHTDRGGGLGLRAALERSPDEVIEVVADSGLRGRGGAGFPTGIKWRSVAEASTDGLPVVVVNAAEGEPSTFKDRQLLRMNPYKVLEGALIAAHAVGATGVVVGLKASFDRELTALERATEEISAAGWLGDVSLEVVAGPSEYLYGEETALLEVLSGRRPFPRVAPPYRRGIEPFPGDDSNAASAVALVEGDGGARPALANNVETLANVPAILAEGAAWFRSVGTPDSPGTLVCTMTGRCATPAVGEVTMGTPLRAAIEQIGGGAAEGRLIAAMSGVANPIVPEHLLDTELSHEAMRSIGSGLGAAGYYVMDERTDIAAVAAGVARFLAVESCGQCEPCKRDGLAVADELETFVSMPSSTRTSDTLERRLDTVADNARCALASQVQAVIGSALELFPDDFRARATASEPEPILPLVDLADGHATLDTTHLSKQPDWSHDQAWSGAWPAASSPPTGPGPAPTPQSSAAAGDAVGQRRTAALPPRDEGDPLWALTELSGELRQDLDRALVDPDGERGLDALRAQLVLFTDVMARVVHPWILRVAPGEGDDAVWTSELDELDAVQLAEDAEPDALRAAAEKVRAVLADDEPRAIALLRAHLDDDQLRDVGDAVHEARMSSVATG